MNSIYPSLKTWQLNNSIMNSEYGYGLLKTHHDYNMFKFNELCSFITSEVSYHEGI